MKVFVTGGAGYIGSHTLVRRLAEGHVVCVFDNFSNSSVVALGRANQFGNRARLAVEDEIALRRPGDITSSDAGTHKSTQRLSRRAGLAIDAMCASSWRWQPENPLGFPARETIEG